MESLKAHLLVASHYLADPNFARSVVLIIQHDQDGALGLVLNRPTQTTISELWKQISDEPLENEQPLHVGGPLNGPLMALHNKSWLSDIEVREGVHFSTDMEKVKELIQTDSGECRLFVGYSGWGGGQLESELKEGSWLTIEAWPDHVFGEQTGLWDRVTKQIGDTLLMSSLGVKRVPKQPGMN